MTGSQAIVVMARSPGDSPSTIKTRLAAVVPGPDDRTNLYLAFVRDLLASCREVPHCALHVACTSADGLDTLSSLGVPIDGLSVQRGSDLGSRERAIFEDLFATGRSRVVLIGSDLPTLPSRYLTLAFERLAEGPGRVVLGPAADGGYYLLGLDRPDPDGRLPDLFTGIRWSTPHAFADTVAAAARERLEIALVPGWYDVDDEEGLGTLREDLRRSPGLAPATRAALARLGLLD